MESFSLYLMLSKLLLKFNKWNLMGVSVEYSVLFYNLLLNSFKLGVGVVIVRGVRKFFFRRKKVVNVVF